jgi:hypothetical protein
VLTKPPNIANDPFKSAKWDELTAGRGFTTSDAPALALLCQWYKLAQQAMDELEPAHVLLYGGNVGFDFGAIEQIEYKAGGFHGR